jgi:prophage regulatory protein
MNLESLASQKIDYGYMRQKELLTLLPFSSATLWRKVKAGTFVKPVKLSPRITAWPRAKVYSWLQKQGGAQ